MLPQHDLQDLIERLERSGAYKVLRQLDVRKGRTSVPYHGGETFIGAVVDVETTGLDVTTDSIIELAMRRFRFDRRGRILKIDEAHSWLEDPGKAICPDVERITGLTNADLAGKRIDDAEASRLLQTTGRIIAHNAAFDRKFIEKRLPAVKGLPWACTLREFDWCNAGFDGQKLAWLASQAGWFFAAHRAGNDVDAVIALLTHVGASGRTILNELIERSNTLSILIEAVGASYDVKDALRRRGYCWDSSSKLWSKEIPPEELCEEEFWLGRNVYGPDCRARACGPRITKLTARERYA